MDEFDFDAFDFSAPEEVPVDPEEEAAFAEAKLAEIRVREDTIIVPNLVEVLVAASPDVWIPILLVQKDHEERRRREKETYTKDFPVSMRGLYPKAEYDAQFEGMELRLLCKACASAVASVRFTNDGGRAEAAMQGKAAVVVDDWFVDEVKREKHVVPVTSQHAVDLQLFCSSVVIGHTQKVVNTEKGRSAVMTVPKLVERNVMEREKIPLAVRRIFSAAMVFGDPSKGVAKVDAKRLDSAPFIWSVVADTVKDVEVPIDGIPLPLIYFHFARLNFGYFPRAVSLEDVIYSSYPNVHKELTHAVAKHSVCVGGVFLNEHHFANFGIRRSRIRHIGGEFTGDMVYFNTNKKVIWEKAGAAIESPISNLETQIHAVRNMSEFDGLWWNPTLLNPYLLPKAQGFIIPYDKDARGIAFLNKWISLHKDKYWRIWCHYGPMPALWIELSDEEDAEATPYNPYAVELVWKTMGVMCIYNLLASLNRNWALAQAKGDREARKVLLDKMNAKSVPVHPVTTLRVDGVNFYNYEQVVRRSTGTTSKKVRVPAVFPEFMSLDYIPGRWTATAKPDDESDALRAGWEMYGDYVAGAKAGDPGFGGGPAKKPEAAAPREGAKEVELDWATAAAKHAAKPRGPGDVPRGSGAPRGPARGGSAFEMAIASATRARKSGAPATKVPKRSETSGPGAMDFSD